MLRTKIRNILLLLSIPLLGFTQVNNTINYNGVVPVSNKTGMYSGDRYYQTYNSDALALFDRMDVQLTSAEKQLTSDMIDSLQLYYIWDSTDCLYLTCMPLEQQAKQNWKADTFNLYPVGNPTFTTYYGFTGTGSSYLNSWFKPSDNNGHYTQNSASFGVGLDSILLSSGYFGATRSAPGLRVFINPHTGGNASSVINCSAGPAVANSRLNEIFIVNRVVSNEMEFYIGKNKTASSQTSSAPIDYDLYFLARNSAGTAGNFSQNNMHFGIIGGGFTTTQIEKINDLVDWYVSQMRVLGILAAATPTEETFLFQASIAGGDRTVNFNINDTIKLNSEIYLDSRTTLNFINSPIKQDADYCNIFINRGALTKTFNTDIEFNGLDLLCESSGTAPTLVYGLRARLGFFFIKNLTLTNTVINNPSTYNFSFEAEKFENVLIDSIIITSDKDGIDFVCGHDAVVRNAYIDTRDDASYIGGGGWPTTQPPALGDCYNISYVNWNVRYTGDGVQVGRGLYIAAQSWADWTVDSTYQTGDMCLTGSKIYQVNNTESFSAIAANEPIHESGIVVGADGISWRMIDTGDYYHTETYNVSIDSSNYYGNTNFLMIPNTDSENNRNTYPGTETLPRISNITVSNTIVSNTNAALVNMNVDSITFSGCTFDSLGYFIVNGSEGINIDSTMILSINNNFTNLSDNFISSQTKKIVFESTNDSYENSIFDNTAYTGIWTGVIRVIDNQTLPFETLTNLTPLTGDICTDLTGTYEWDGDSWEEY